MAGKESYYFANPEEYDDEGEWDDEEMSYYPRSSHRGDMYDGGPFLPPPPFIPLQVTTRVIIPTVQGVLPGLHLPSDCVTQFTVLTSMYPHTYTDQMKLHLQHVMSRSVLTS